MGWTKKDEIKIMEAMTKSCYAYNGLRKDNSFILKYKKILGKETFEKIYNKQEKYLKDNFVVEKNTYEDSEGLIYNSLRKK